MNTNTQQDGARDSSPMEPEENLATTAYDATFSSIEFDREHGDEVESARRMLEAYAEIEHPAA